MSRITAGAALLLTAGLLVPEGARAAVLISEFAWMGSAGNANAEWIELQNTGADSVSLAGWTITSAGTAPNITLSGSIAPGAYFLLERTSDASVPEIAADHIYTGALSNSGDTLTLKNATGSIIDQVVGGNNWESVGGDNATKHTPQRNGSLWVTNDPTPKALNATQNAAAPTSTTTPSTTTPTTGTTTPTIGGSAPAPAPAQSPVRRITLDVGPNRVVSANVPSPFTAVAYGQSGRAVDANITWNFGDGVVRTGEEVSHTYREPGEYMVTARARDKDANTLAVIRVVVDSPLLRAVKVPGGVAVTNRSGRLVDLSGWKLSEGSVAYAFPRDTGIWPGGTIVLRNEVTGLPGAGPVALQYPGGEVAPAPLEPTLDPEPVFEPAPEESALIPEPAPEAAPAGPVVLAPVLTLQPPPTPESIKRIQTVELPEAPTTQQTYEDGIDAPAAPALSAAAGAAVLPKIQLPRWAACLFGSVLTCSASFSR